MTNNTKQLIKVWILALLNIASNFYIYNEVHIYSGVCLNILLLILLLKLLINNTVNNQSIKEVCIMILNFYLIAETIVYLIGLTYYYIFLKYLIV